MQKGSPERLPYASEHVLPYTAFWSFKELGSFTITVWALHSTQARFWRDRMAKPSPKAWLTYFIAGTYFS